MIGTIEQVEKKHFFRKKLLYVGTLYDPLLGHGSLAFSTYSNEKREAVAEEMMITTLSTVKIVDPQIFMLHSFTSILKTVGNHLYTMRGERNL